MPELILRDQTRIAFETIPGDPELPTLVFLHEGLGCIAMWKDFPRNLCAALRCPGLVYDRNGYGGSSPLRKPRTLAYLQEYAQDELPEIIEQTIPDRPFFLIGHSDGGTIALLYASRQGNPLLRGVITEAAHVFVEPETLAGIKPAVEAFRLGKLRGLERYHGEKTETIFFAWAETWLSEEFRTWNIEAALGSISCPVLAIQGEFDQYGTDAQLKKIVAGIPNARSLMIGGCGHSPHLEQKEKTLGIMAEFIRERY